MQCAFVPIGSKPTAVIPICAAPDLHQAADLVILSIAVNLGEKLIDFTIASGPAALTLNLLTMLLGYGLGKWLLHNEAQARTICLEVGLQNGTLTLLITTSILQSAEMSIAPSVYSLIMFITATLFTFRAGRKPQPA